MVEFADLFAMLATKPRSLPIAGEAGLAAGFKQAALSFIAGSADNSGRYKDYLRASGLGDVCGRAEGIRLLQPGLRVGEKRNAGGVLTVNVGHAQHSWWQNRYLGPMNWLWGRWLCIRCSSSTLGLMPEQCPNCNAHRRDWIEYTDEDGEVHRDYVDVITYAEFAVRDDKLRYSGHPDGLLVVPWRDPDDDKVLFEFKTIKTDRYEPLKGPKPEHVQQVHAYMRRTNTREALVVYADKGKQAQWRISAGRFISGEARVKVFRVAYDDEVWAEVERRIHDHWRAVSGVSPRELPRMCRSPSCFRARLCTAREVCFSYPEDPK